MDRFYIGATFAVQAAHGLFVLSFRRNVNQKTRGRLWELRMNSDMSKVAGVVVLVFASLALAAATVKVPLKTGWRFIKADDPSCKANLSQGNMSAILDQAHRTASWGLFDAPAFAWAARTFDDSGWARVRVPHDWGVEKSFDAALPYGDAHLAVTGVGWYRLAFDVPPDWKGKTVYFECDGAMSYAMAYLNGRFVGGWPYGYTRWRIDLTPGLDVGATNVIAVRCHNLRDSSRWYTGGGLYRACRLLVCDADHVVPGSVFISTPDVTKERATVRVVYEMSRSGRRERSFTVENPRLWDIDDPYLYDVDVEGDRYRYGIRTISFHADARGFQLNGRRVPLNGVSMHHDFGVLGAAWNRTAQERRLRAFKEAGVNAVRSAHNPPDEGLLELCDELGAAFQGRGVRRMVDRRARQAGERLRASVRTLERTRRAGLGADGPQPPLRDHVFRRQ